MRVTFTLAGVCFAVFVLQAVFGDAFTELFALTPTIAWAGAYWQFITYMFLHASPIHLLFNMFAFAMLGPPVEYRLGTKKYLALYFLAGVGSAFLHMVLAGGPDTLLLGASGAVFGVMTAYGFLYPKNWVYIMGLVPLPAAFAVVAFAGFELFLGVTGLEPGIANFGHLGGILTGAVFMLVFRSREHRVPIEERTPRTCEFAWE